MKNISVWLWALFMVFNCTGALRASQSVSGVPSAATDNEAFDREVTRLTVELRSLKALADEWPGFVTCDTGAPRIARAEERMKRVIQIATGVPADTDAGKMYTSYIEIAKPVLQRTNPDLYQWVIDQQLAHKVQYCRAKLGAIMQGLEAFNLDNARYPDTDQGLAVLVQGSRPIIESDVLTDPWNNPMQYRLNPDGFDYKLFSCGPDGKPGTEDDISYLK